MRDEGLRGPYSGICGILEYGEEMCGSSNYPKEVVPIVMLDANENGEFSCGCVVVNKEVKRVDCCDCAKMWERDIGFRGLLWRLMKEFLPGSGKAGMKIERGKSLWDFLLVLDDDIETFSCDLDVFL